jgi:hypothetical protein
VTSDGGKNYALNVVPTEAYAVCLSSLVQSGVAATTKGFDAQGFDIRLPPSVDMAKFEEKIKEVRSAGQACASALGLNIVPVCCAVDA